MAVAGKRPKMKRTQVCLMPDEYEMARSMARARRVSLSQVVRDALRSEAERSGEIERKRSARMLSIVGIVKNADPDDSVRLDEIIYGKDIR